MARLQANDYPREIAALKIQLAEAQKNAVSSTDEHDLQLSNTRTRKLTEAIRSLWYHTGFVHTPGCTNKPQMVDAQVNQQIHLLKAELEASKKKNQEFELEMEKMNTGCKYFSNELLDLI